MTRPTPLVSFIHINKNAGTTVRDLLRRNYPANELFEVMVQGRRSVDGSAKNVDGLDEDVCGVIAEVQRRQHDISCFAANLPFGLHKYLDRPIAYFTFLREPVSRCISYWYFAYQTRNEGKLWSNLERCDFDLDKIRESQVAYQFSNDQVRMVTGCSAQHPGRTELSLACEIIERDFVLAGTVEYLEDCMRTLAGKLGWNAVSPGRCNVGVKTDSSILPPGAETYFRDTNEWDIRLYEWLLKDYLPRKLRQV